MLNIHEDIKRRYALKKTKAKVSNKINLIVIYAYFNIPDILYRLEILLCQTLKNSNI